MKAASHNFAIPAQQAVEKLKKRPSFPCPSRHSRESGNPAYESFLRNKLWKNTKELPFLRKQESSIRALEGTLPAIRPATKENCQLGIGN